MTDPGSADPDVVTDRLFDGALILRQRRRGHRAGTDAVLLAAAAAPLPGDEFIDVGAGVGTVGLAIALRQPQCRGVLLERDPNAAALAHANIAGNMLDGRVTTASVDIFDDAACASRGLVRSASMVVTNPPFYLEQEVRGSPEPGKINAHVLRHRGEGVGHGDWISRALRLLRPRGRFLAIHRPEALPALLAVCDRHMGNIVLRLVHPKSDRPAIRVLIGGRLGSRSPLSVLAPLILHGPTGVFTEEAEALHRGASMEFWSQKSRPSGPASPVDGRLSSRR